MHRETDFGIVYSNERLGIEEQAFQLDAKFVTEGKEKQLDEDTWIIGHIPPTRFDKKDPAQVILAREGCVFIVSQERLYGGKST